MDNLTQVRVAYTRSLAAALLIGNLLVLGCSWAGMTYLGLSPLVAASGGIIIGLLAAGVAAQALTNYFIAPLEAVWLAVLHLSPSQQGIPAPKKEELKVGRELVTSLTAQLYQLMNVTEKAAAEEEQFKKDLTRNFVAQNLPLPLFVLDETDTITYANEAAAKYVGIPAADMITKNVYMVLDMSFPSEDTFDHWLKGVKTTSATAVNSWERVRLNVRDNHPTRLFDLAVYYNRDNPEHKETMLVLFDHTKQYSQDDQAVSFIALSVHELRTPLTLLRGYIEVFDEELEGKIHAELQGFMEKMRSQADQLMAFVNNILNVARVDDDQLELHLMEEDWSTILKSAIDMISLRAKVRGITLKCSVTVGLPPVGVDSLSIREVLNNLIDNAIKYSADSKVIEINSHLTPEGLIETTVRDYGQGIPPNIMSNLFTKFYRDHRNRAQIGGTGLGLYLSKAIVDAHGGQIWVKSKEGEGSTFGFTLMPYAQLAEELKHSGNNEITRGAHGWIKNHSLYRR